MTGLILFGALSYLCVLGFLLLIGATKYTTTIFHDALRCTTIPVLGVILVVLLIVDTMIKRLLGNDDLYLFNIPWVDRYVNIIADFVIDDNPLSNLPYDKASVQDAERYDTLVILLPIVIQYSIGFAILMLV